MKKVFGLFSLPGHNNVSRQTSSEDKENSGDDQMKELAAKNEKISVKERTKTFNRMASEVNSRTLGLHSTEVAYLLLTLQLWVRFSAFPIIFLLMFLIFIDSTA